MIQTMKTTHLVTRESLTALVTRKDAVAIHALGRALVVLFNRQTESEKRSDTTNMNNMVGFTGADARSGCLTAKYFLKHGTLLEWQVERWLKIASNGHPRISKYWRQLDEAAQIKARKAANNG